MHGIRFAQREGRDPGVEPFAGLRHHLIGAFHGAKRRRQRAAGRVGERLVRLEQRGWIDTEWRTTENSRRAKYYRLTAAGRRALGQELASWNRFVAAVGLVIAAES